MNLLGAIGQAKPVSEFINTAGQYQTTQSNLESQRLAQQKAQMDIAQADKEQAHLDQTVDFRLSPFYLSLPDEAKPIAEKMYQGAGAVDQNFMGKRRDMLRVTGDIEKSKGAFETLMKPITDAKHTAAVKAYEKWVKSGDPKDEEAYKVARAQAEDSKGTYFKHLDDLEKEKLKIEANNSKLGAAVGDSESGEVFYNSPRGLVTADGTPYDSQAHGPISKVVEATNTINEFQTFYRGMKEQNPNVTEAEISKAWSDKKAAELATRIPSYTTGSGLPPGYVLNRRTGNYEWRGEGTAPGMSPVDAATFQADKASLQNQTKLTDMMKSFVGNMNAQVDRLTEISKDISRTDARLVNLPLRELRMRVKGSAIESKVGMYLTEISNEIGKLSTGSQASVRELSESAQKKWDKIHDPNLSIKDLLSLLNETKHAGSLRLKSAENVISETKKRLGGGGGTEAGGSDPYGIR